MRCYITLLAGFVERKVLMDINGEVNACMGKLALCVIHDPFSTLLWSATGVSKVLQQC